MRLDEKQQDALAKSIISIGTYVLTAVPFGLFIAPKAIEWWAYILVFCFGLFLLCTGISLSRKTDDEPRDSITAEIRKGVFHIDNATIKKEGKTENVK